MTDAAIVGGGVNRSVYPLPLNEPIPVDAPPRTETPLPTRPSKWDLTIARLATHPGQWFMICEYGGGATPHYLADLAMKRGIAIELTERVGGPRGNRVSRIYARSLPSSEDVAS